LQLITYNPFLQRDGERPPYRSSPKPLISPVFPHPLVRTHPNSGKKSSGGRRNRHGLSA
jgi:taurine dioxygenase